MPMSQRIKTDLLAWHAFLRLWCQHCRAGATGLTPKVSVVISNEVTRQRVAAAHNLWGVRWLVIRSTQPLSEVAGNGNVREHISVIRGYACSFRRPDPRSAWLQEEIFTEGHSLMLSCCLGLRCSFKETLWPFRISERDDKEEKDELLGLLDHLLTLIWLLTNQGQSVFRK